MSLTPKPAWLRSSSEAAPAAAPSTPGRRWSRGRIPAAVLSGLLFVALAANLLASELPLLLRHDGAWFVLPALKTPRALQGEDIDSLRTRLVRARGDFLIAPPVPHGPNETALSESLLPPSPRHWLGTDELGRDVLARLIHGARVSLLVAFGGVALAVVLGMALGGWAGARGGWVDALVLRLTDVLLSFPTLLLVLVVSSLLQLRSAWPLVLLLGLTRWTEVARLVRGEVLRLREMPYVAAARVSGATPAAILRRHLLPGTLGPVLVSATFALPGAVLLESALAFIGFGVPPPTPSWGELLSQAHRYLTHLPSSGSSGGAWWLALFPGLLLFTTALSFHRLGEALRSRGATREAGGRI